jgi:hypothetical protein
MKIVDYPELENTAQASGSMERVLSSLPLRRSLPPEVQAQESIISHLQRSLSNQYQMVRNVRLEGLKAPVPMTVVGPSGVHVLNASLTRGLFRAKNEAWEKMDDRTRQFTAHQPNLVARTLWFGRKVGEYLAGKGISTGKLETVLLFPHPGTHVEAQHPAVRIVLADALDRFTAGLLSAPPVLRPEEVQTIVDELLAARPGPPVEEAEQILAPAFTFSGSAPGRAERKDPLAALSKKISFTGRQWAMLAILLVVNIFVLFAFLMVYLMLT